MFGRGRLGGAEEKDPEPDLSPMIDCVFILLIFFIVTAVFVEEEGFSLPLPEDSSAVSSVSEQSTVIFTISESNVVEHEHRKIGIDGVGAIVRSALLKDEDTPVIIQSHPKAQHGICARVQDEVRKAGAENYTLTQG